MTLEKNANHIWITPEGRTSFLNVYTARPNKLRQMAPYYDFTLLFPKTDTQGLAALPALVAELSSRVLGTNVPPRSLYPGDPKSGSNDKPVFKDGDAMYAQKPDTYEVYRGMWVLSLSSPQKNPILVQDTDRQEIMDESVFQSGDYGIAAIEISVYRSSVHGPQLSFRPKVVRKTRDGEHFGGGVSNAAAAAAMDGAAPPATAPPAKKPLL